MRRAVLTHAVTALASLSIAVAAIAAPPEGTPPEGAPVPVVDGAASQQEADELYADGQSLFRQGRYAAAIVAFERGLALSGDVNFVFNIALCHDRLNQFDEARAAFEKYRHSAPATEHKALDERLQGLRLRKADALAREKAQAAREKAQQPVCPEPEPVVVLPPPPPPRPKIMTPGAIALATVTGLLASGSVVLGTISIRQTRAARNTCSDATGQLRCTTASGDYLRRARSTAIAADVGIALASATAAGLASVLIINTLRRRRGHASQRADRRDSLSLRGRRPMRVRY